MNLYRAIYRTKSGHERRMTFAERDAKAAHRVAEEWELSDDRLQGVAALRLRQDQFRLTGEVMQ